jgi:hypothetical protein
LFRYHGTSGSRAAVVCAAVVCNEAAPLAAAAVTLGGESNRPSAGLPWGGDAISDGLAKKADAAIGLMPLLLLHPERLWLQEPF